MTLYKDLDIESNRITNDSWRLTDLGVEGVPEDKPLPVCILYFDFRLSGDLL